MGKVTLNRLKELVEKSEIDTVVCAAPDHYGRLVGKRLRAKTFFNSALKEEGLHGSLFLMTVDMEMEPREGYEVTDWNRGFQDFRFVPDLNTLRIIPWQNKTALVFCDLFHETSNELIPIAPRSILKSQISRASKLGLSIKCATELEFFLYANDLNESWSKKYENLTPVSRFRSDYGIFQGTLIEDFSMRVRELVSAADVEVEFSKPEWGLGQQEINLRYAEALEMADRHVLFKMATKEIAAQQGWTATFMAKPYIDEVGSSCHIHLSLWDEQGTKPLSWCSKSPNNISQIMSSFLGGTIAATSDFTACYAPTVNSYKRLQPETFAPTKIALGDDNRTCSHRLCGHADSFRFENRIPGADVQPYIAISAAIASGLYGITNGLKSPKLYVGNAYQDNKLKNVATSFSDAINRFKSSDIVLEGFGKEVKDHLSNFYTSENDDFQRMTVTDWERMRYFERI